MRAFESRYGLAAVAGGRHPGVGTANAIVPLGGAQYLELIAVVDEAEVQRDPLRRRLLDLVRDGQTFGTWVLRAETLDNLDEVVPIGAVVDGSRARPDGTQLTWRSAYPRDMLSGTGLPFFITWASAEHPGDGPVRRRVERVTVEDSEDGPVRALLSAIDVDVEIEVVPGSEPRLVALELEGLTIR